MLTLTGVSPEPGESLVDPSSTIEFTIVDDGTGIDISSLIVLVDGERVLEEMVFDEDFDGALSEITTSGSNYNIAIDPINDFDIGKVVSIKVQVKDSSGLFFNTTYSFKTTPAEPVLASQSPPDRSTVGKREFVFLEFEDTIDGVDVDSINISINNLDYVIGGEPVAGTNSFLTDVTLNGNRVVVRIDNSEPFRDGDYQVDYSVDDTNGNTLLGDFEFTVKQNKISLPSQFKQVGFLGYFQGIKKVSDLGCGDSLKIEWNQPVVRDFTYEAFPLIYQNPERLSTFDGLPKYIALDTASDLTINGLTPGDTLSYGVRAMEAIKNIFDLTGMVSADTGVFFVPDPVSVSETILDTGNRIKVDSVSGYPAAGLIIVGREVMRYTALDTTNPAFLVPNNGRGLFGSTPGVYIEGDDVKLYLDCQDDNLNIVFGTPSYQDGYQSGREIDSRGILYPDFSDNDRKFFQGYDFCGYHRTLPQNALNGDDDCGSYLGGEFDGLRGFSLYDRMLNREEVLLDQVGEPVVLLRKIINGEKCSCATSRRDHPKMRTCAECFGTTYVGGYEQFCNRRREDNRLMVSFQEAVEDLSLGPSHHLQQEFEPSVWTLPTPAIKDRDIIVRFDFTGDIEYIYEVLDSSREKLLYQNFGRQKLRIKRMDKTDILYTLVNDALLDGSFCEFEE